MVAVGDSYTVGGLFAGVGGICKGFKEADFNILWANDFDKNACVTYRNNFEHAIDESDIHDLGQDRFPRVDVITSGFPCQAFSVAGYQNGFKDHRGNLFFETMRFIKALKPKAILLENVRNLEKHDKGRTFKIIEKCVLDHGYSFMPKILNSMEYGNVPQTRERIYMVGFRGESGYAGGVDSKSICSSAFEFPGEIPLTVKVKDLLDEDVPDDYYYTNHKYYKAFREFVWSKDTVYQWRRIYLRENKRNVCPTLTANMGTGGHNVPLIEDDRDIRKLTPRECFRLQGFPEDFKLPNISRSQLYKQAGNSVTVPVIKRIAENIRSALDVKYKTSEPVSAVRSSS